MSIVNAILIFLWLYHCGGSNSEALYNIGVFCQNCNPALIVQGMYRHPGVPWGTSEREGGKRCAERGVIPPVVQLGALRHSRIKCSARGPAVQCFSPFPVWERCRALWVFLVPVR